MSQNAVTLLIGLGGIFATLVSAFLGFYYNAKARVNPLSEMLFAKQLDLIQKVLHTQGRLKVYLIMAADPTSPYQEQARTDLGTHVQEYSELLEQSTALLPTSLWVEMRRLRGTVEELVILIDDGKFTELTALKQQFTGIDTKIALLARTALGLDELTNKRIKLYASVKAYEKVAASSAADLISQVSKPRKE